MAHNRKSAILLSQIKELQDAFDEMKMIHDDENSDFQSNDIMEELINFEKVQKYHRKYSSKLMAISMIAFIYGSKAYNFLSQFLPLPHENSLRKWFSPEIKFFIEGLTNKENLPPLINEFVQMDSFNIHSVLAIDAAKFKEAKGDLILKKFPFCKNIKPDKIYNNVFIFY